MSDPGTSAARVSRLLHGQVVEDARAEADDAMRALAEIKKATNKKKRPHLRRAYVRREMVPAQTAAPPKG